MIASLPHVDPSRWPDAFVFSVLILAVAWVIVVAIKEGRPIE